MTSDSPDQLLPLSPIVFHMLIALADGEKHGYGIMKTVEDDSRGEMRIPLGTLYGSIKRMLAAKLIEETEARPDPALDDERRRYYRITPFGQQVLRAEIMRLDKQLALVRSKYIPGWADQGRAL
jgi:DNA-binding PadR family transcriptional regulator